MEGSSTTPADFFVLRAVFFFFFFFYDYVLFGNSVIIRRAIYLIDFLAMCYGPFISIGIILLFCFCLFVRFYFL